MKILAVEPMEPSPNLDIREINPVSRVKFNPKTNSSVQKGEMISTERKAETTEEIRETPQHLVDVWA